jgi:hypothetical protein
MLRLAMTVFALIAIWPAEAEAAKWTALAFSEKVGAFGKSWGFSTEDEARRRALDECRKHADDCAVVVVGKGADRGEETCIALASMIFEQITSDGAARVTRSPITATSKDREEASRSALQSCNDARSRAVMLQPGPKSECRAIALSCSGRP